EVGILLATKTVAPGPIRQALRAGGRVIGENRVQEMTAKAPELAELVHETHLIGPLQRNKARAAAACADCVQTVADLRLAERLAALAADSAALAVMIQVNTSGEATKAGCPPAEAPDLAEAVATLPGLRLRGFMTVGLNSPDSAAVARSYATLRAIRDQVLAAAIPGAAGARELSMGMSGDLEIAIAEGSTMVRVGSAVFGPRG
ncbi:MAG: YggS family pyridoxal phosphate-dependent enzyme, partial [Bifidobacteriaceae bacterium]|nr:YggS family pyridoxal phosphate-dependent enzyme [Bifidobacteriaceae bacterium]